MEGSEGELEGGKLCMVNRRDECIGLGVGMDVRAVVMIIVDVGVSIARFCFLFSLSIAASLLLFWSAASMGR